MTSHDNDPSSDADSVPLLSVRHLSVDFLCSDGTVAHAVEDVSFDIHGGETIGLVGESGCGKTTTMLALMRLLPSTGRITAGQVIYNGVDLLSLSEREMRHYRWKEMAMVFQSAMNALNPVLTVGEQILEPILHHDLMDREAAEKRVEELLDLVGIAKNRKDQYPHQYSGGMRQRAMIAMALACQPHILFADEPTTALDVMIQAQVLELLERIQREFGLAIALVTHDLGVVAEVCDSVVVMYGGKVAEYGTSEQVYNFARHPYTQRLLSAFPDLNAPGNTLASIPGFPPRLNALPPGCRFEPRCDQKVEVCKRLAPVSVDVTGGERDKTAKFPIAHLASCHLCQEDQN
jgi:peptide/nickel transport system ATP-binding protein